MRVVAIDQGTTSTRALVVGSAGQGPDGGEIVCRRSHAQNYPAPGRVEHDPEELLSHIRQCLAAAGPADAIGLANQGESCLAWDRETGRAISPVIVWQDQRTRERIEALKADGAEALVMARAGLPLDAYFSASKLAWIVRNLPEAGDLLARGRLCLGTTDAFFLHRLTGRFVTDITTASRTSLMALETGQWDDDLCALFGVPVEALPEIVPTMGDFGAAEMGGRRVAVTASAVDQQAALYGHGCRAPGDGKITFGTGAFALVVSGNAPPRGNANGILPTIAWQRQGTDPVYALDGGVYCAGSAVNWARSLGLFREFAEIGAFTAPAAIERGLAFVPALSGLGAPYWDRHAAGLWVGLSLDTTARDMVQAILEGIAFRAAQVLDAMAATTAIGPVISIDGGMAANPYFCQFLADVTEREITVPHFAELTALGVARMAMDGNGQEATEGKGVNTYRAGRNMSALKERFARAVSLGRDWK